MDRTTCIMVEKVDEGWLYEGVFEDTKEHAFNLDIIFKKPRCEYEVLIDQSFLILPDKLDPEKCLGYAIRKHSEKLFKWN